MGCVWTYFLLFVYFLLCWKLTFYSDFHPLLEFHCTYSVHFLLSLGSSLQNDKEVPCMQTKVEIKSNTIQNTMVITCGEKECEDQVRLNPECHNGHLQGEEGKD